MAKRFEGTRFEYDNFGRWVSITLTIQSEHLIYRTLHNKLIIHFKQRFFWKVNGDNGVLAMDTVRTKSLSRGKCLLLPKRYFEVPSIILYRWRRNAGMGGKGVECTSWLLYTEEISRKASYVWGFPRKSGLWKWWQGTWKWMNKS